MRLDGALCAGSDAWFPDNNQDRAVVVGLCRNECPAYRECLEYALTRPAVSGIVAGLDFSDTISRRRVWRPQPKPATVEAMVPCPVCSKPFQPVSGRGRPRKTCSEWCSNMVRKRNQNQARNADNGTNPLYGWRRCEDCDVQVRRADHRHACTVSV